MITVKYQKSMKCVLKAHMINFCLVWVMYVAECQTPVFLYGSCNSVSLLLKGCMFQKQLDNSYLVYIYFWSIYFCLTCVMIQWSLKTILFLRAVPKLIMVRGIEGSQIYCIYCGLLHFPYRYVK